ncbi:MAG TPA: hypothetical protein VHM24_04350 [Gemmatimonadaceae bacterium]|nr:hypothetical protein [Gemmatimonadaceae bacterium]
MTWKSLYLIAFLGGLAIAVNGMLHGTERWRRRTATRPSALLNAPTIAALTAGFGAAGYLLLTRSSFNHWVVFIIASLIGTAAFSGMTVLMAKWALRRPVPHTEDEEINGQIATVSREITISHPGEITYFAYDQKHVLPASSIDGADIPVNTEVVIDVVEDGVARVELWSIVEQRL